MLMFSRQYPVHHLRLACSMLMFGNLKHKVQLRLKGMSCSHVVLLVSGQNPKHWANDGARGKVGESTKSL